MKILATVISAPRSSTAWPLTTSPIPPLGPNFQAQLAQTGNDVMAAILKRAAERGETRDDIPPRVAALPFDLLRNTLLLSPRDSRAITEIVNQVFLPLVLQRG